MTSPPGRLRTPELPARWYGARERPADPTVAPRADRALADLPLELPWRIAMNLAQRADKGRLLALP